MMLVGGDSASGARRTNLNVSMIVGTPTWLRMAWATLFLLLASFIATPAALAQEAKQASDTLTIQLDGTETADQIKTIVEGVSNGARPIIIQIAKPAAPPPETQARDEFENVLVANLEHGTFQGWNEIAFIPKLFTDLSTWWQGSPPFLLTILKLVAILAAGVLVGAMVFAIARRLAASRPALLMGEFSLAARLRYSLRRTGGAAAAFAIGMIAAALLVRMLSSLATAEREFLGFAVEFVLSIGIILLIGWFLLAPGEPSRRVLLIPNAEKHWAFLCGFAVMNPLFVFLAKLGNAPQEGAQGVAGLIFIFTTIGALYKIWWFWMGRKDIAHLIYAGGPVTDQPSAIRKAFASTTPMLLILSAILVWMIGRASSALPDGYNWAYAASFTQFLIILAPIAATGASQLARELLQRPELSTAPMQSAIRSLVVKLSGGAVWLLSIMILWMDMAVLREGFRSLCAVFGPDRRDHSDRRGRLDTCQFPARAVPGAGTGPRW